MKVQQEHGYYTIDLDGKFHSENDEPAIVINSHEDVIMNGDIEDIEMVEGYKAWYSHGFLHRENNPAIIRENGEELYYLNGEFQNGGNNN